MPKTKKAKSQTLPLSKTAYPQTSSVKKTVKNLTLLLGLLSLPQLSSGKQTKFSKMSNNNKRSRALELSNNITSSLANEEFWKGHNGVNINSLVNKEMNTTTNANSKAWEKSKKALTTETIKNKDNQNRHIKKLKYTDKKTNFTDGGSKYTKQKPKERKELSSLPIISKGKNKGKVIDNEYLEFPKKIIFPSHLKHGKTIYKPSIWNTDGKQFVKFIKQ